MIADFNQLAVQSHFNSVAEHKIRSTAILTAARRNPGIVAAMYASRPTLLHELPLGQVAQVAEELCDAGFTNVIADMSENRSVQKDYREVLSAVTSGESVIV